MAWEDWQGTEKLDKGRGKDAPRSYSLSPVSATEKDNLMWINTLGCQLPYVFIYCKGPGKQGGGTGTMELGRGGEEGNR